MLIENREPKGEVKDSGYYRAVGDVAIADLLRKTQSAVIANGNELEKLIFKYSKHPKTLRDQKIPGFNLSQKQTFVVQMRIENPGSKNIALDCFLAMPDQIYIFEMKDGMNFDTKKSAGEVASLKRAAAYLKERDALSRPVIPKIVLWNCEDLSFSSFKCKEGVQMLMLGHEFAKLVGIDKKTVDKQRVRDRNINRAYIISRMKEIVEAA